jgi:hypothetical protein
MIRPTLTGSSSVPFTKLLLRPLCDGRRGLEFGDVEALAALAALRTLLVLEVDVEKREGRFSTDRDCKSAMGIDGSLNAAADDLDSVEGWGIDGVRNADDGASAGTITSCFTWLAPESVSIDVCDADGVKGCA